MKTADAERAAREDATWLRLDQQIGLPAGTMRGLSPATLEELLALPEGTGGEPVDILEEFSGGGHIAPGTRLSLDAMDELVDALGLPLELAEVQVPLSMLLAVSQPEVAADAAPTGLMGQALATLGYDGSAPPTPALLRIAETYLGVIGMMDMSEDARYFMQVERIVQAAEPMQVGPQWTIRVPGLDPDEPSIVSDMASGLGEELIGSMVSQGVGSVLTVLSVLSTLSDIYEQNQLRDWCTALSRGRWRPRSRTPDSSGRSGSRPMSVWRPSDGWSRRSGWRRWGDSPAASLTTSTTS